ncbi:MAG: peptide chain release factor N(5)-glutamine methyltransferase [bacterium]
MAIKTVREAIKEISKECLEYLPNKDRDVVKILEHILEINEVGVFSSLDIPLSEKQEDKLKDIIEKIKKDEPLEYITNIGYFYGHRFMVTKDTLIPRPETEILVDIAISRICEMIHDPNYEGKEIELIDIGTGTACIPISISLSQGENLKITAVDISEKALEVANKNISDSKQDKITTLVSDLFDKVKIGKKFDIILANLPYISTENMKDLPSSVKNYEPSKALDGGKLGIKLIEQLLNQSVNRIKENGSIILEMDPSQIDLIKKKVRKVFKKPKFTRFKDLSDQERFLLIEV